MAHAHQPTRCHVKAKSDMLERADLPQMRSTVLPDASALNSVLAFRAVPYVFCSADRTKSGSRVRTLKAKRYSRLSSLSIPIPSRVARDAIGFSPQAIQFFANCMHHYTIVHLGPPRREIRLPLFCRHCDPRRHPMEFAGFAGFLRKTNSEMKYKSWQAFQADCLGSDTLAAMNVFDLAQKNLLKLCLNLAASGKLRCFGGSDRRACRWRLLKRPVGCFKSSLSP